MAFHTLPRRSGPHAASTTDQGQGGGGLQEGEGALKRSSSMFIPQLLGSMDTRPTRSSSVQISLQRKAADGAPDGTPDAQDGEGDFGEGASRGGCLEPPPGTPSCSPPPAARGAGLQVNGTCGRWACCSVVAPDGPEVAERGGGRALRIQHRASSADVRHVTLMPFGAEGSSAAEPRRWSLQHVPDASGSSGKRCFVFQLQQPQPAPGAPALGSDFNFGFTGTKGDRLVRYPRIRLERSTSYPTQPRTEHGSPGEERGSLGHPQTPPRGRRGPPEIHRMNSLERGPQGCMFKIRQDQTAGQQHFRILVTRGPEEASQNSEESKASSPGPTVASTPVS